MIFHDAVCSFVFITNDKNMSYYLLTLACRRQAKQIFYGFRRAMNKFLTTFSQDIKHFHTNESILQKNSRPPVKWKLYRVDIPVYYKNLFNSLALTCVRVSVCARSSLYSHHSKVLITHAVCQQFALKFKSFKMKIVTLKGIFLSSKNFGITFGWFVIVFYKKTHSCFLFQLIRSFIKYVTTYAILLIKRYILLAFIAIAAFVWILV